MAVVKKKIDLEWKKWIRKNLKNGCDKNTIFKILLENGFPYGVIKRQLDFEPSMEVTQFSKRFGSHNEPKAVPASRSAINSFKPFLPEAVKLDSDRIELYTQANFLAPDECETLIERIKLSLQPSGLGSYEPDRTYRTSKTCVLADLEDPFIEMIDQRICTMIGIHRSYSEKIEGQYYEVGQQFKEHTDYFEAYELPQHGGLMGQRSYTFMIYLNDVEEGGETEFRKIGVTFTPKPGMAVVWNSLDAFGNPNINSLHESHPVKKGYKAIITKWFRCNSNVRPSPPMAIRR